MVAAPQTIEASGLALCARARSAARLLANATTSQKNRWLELHAVALEQQAPAILRANRADMERSSKLSPAMLDRLRLDDSRLAGMARALREIAKLPDPVGEIRTAESRPNGLRVEKVGVPLGVILFIYESRPNVTSDAAGLCVKAGNAIILRGGNEALESNRALANAARDSLAQAGLPADAVQFVGTTDRELVGNLLGRGDAIDLVIPRGGEDLIRRVEAQARMPVLKHYHGNCHVYVESTADPAMARRVVIDAKCQRPGTCNAAEKLVVDADWARRHLGDLGAALRERGVTLRACPRSLPLLPSATPAKDDDWDKEYLDIVMGVKVVDGIGEAVDWISVHGSGHSEAIISSSPEAIGRFVREVDAAAVLVNASTRLHDGGEMGLGAEIGISTGKFHARGPCGLRELTSYKYILRGNGQTRG
ncbi:MAG: glutamate-5-semialdehyde dehydrogenase [Planctomycetes bacterium]|nr:glutamate-5-semialdehyde dehydrogenase [Planctomycetota bacterium]